MNRYFFLTLLLLAFVTTPFTICSLAPDLMSYGDSPAKITTSFSTHDTQEHNENTETQTDAGISLMEEIHHDVELSSLFFLNHLNTTDLTYLNQDQNHYLFDFSQKIFRPNI